MGRFFRILFFVGLSGLVIGVPLFIGWVVRQINSDGFRPRLEARITEWTGYEAKLGHISLTWKSGLGLRVERLSLTRKGEEEPFAASDSVFFIFDPFSLLRWKLTFYELVLERPQVHLVVSPTGIKNWETGRGGGTVPAVAGGAALLISKIRGEDGTVDYRDERQNPPLEVGLSKINLSGEQSFPGGPITLRVEGNLRDVFPPELSLEASLKPGTGESQFKLDLGKQVVLAGEAFLLQKPLRFQVGGQVKRLEVRTLFQLSRLREREFMTGLIDGEFEMEGSGLTEGELKNSLSGQARLSVREGVFKDINVLDAVLSRVTVIPGLREALMGAIPPGLQPVFQGRDTPFDLLEGDFDLQAGQAVSRSLLFKNPHYMVQGSGTYTFDGNIQFQGELILLETLSKFLIAKVHEMSLLSNAQGRISIPFRYQGRGSEARFQPDLAYTAQKIAMESGTRLVEKGLEFLSQFAKEREGGNVT